MKGGERLEGYDVALICMNGHVINTMSFEYPVNNTKFCKECGANTIRNCPHCKSQIQGSIDNGFFHEFELPKYCHNCGESYPWTETKLKALEETISLMDELSIDEKQELMSSAKNITTNNPRSSLSALKIKKLSSKIGKELWSVAKEIIIGIGTEASLKQAGFK
jgi:hypothetical protein